MDKIKGNAMHENKHQNASTNSVLFTALGFLSSILIFLIVAALLALAMTIFKGQRGYGEGPVPLVLINNLLIPGVAGFLTLELINKWSSRIDIVHIFWLFSGVFVFLLMPLVIYIGVDSGMFTDDKLKFTLALFSSVSPAAGAYIWMSNDGQF